jgi:hypothetical protein
MELAIKSVIAYMNRFGKSSRETIAYFYEELNRRHPFPYNQLLQCEIEIDNTAEKMSRIAAIGGET